MSVIDFNKLAKDYGPTILGFLEKFAGGFHTTTPPVVLPPAPPPAPGVVHPPVTVIIPPGTIVITPKMKEGFIALQGLLNAVVKPNPPLVLDGWPGDKTADAILAAAKMAKQYGFG